VSDAEVSRWVRGYSKASERLTVEYALPEAWDLARLQELFAADSQDPMFDCFPIGEREALALADSVSGPISLEECDFFLEANAEA
jgi:hypothetical protein